MSGNANVAGGNDEECAARKCFSMLTKNPIELCDLMLV